jgi:hypothetical protein
LARSIRGGSVLALTTRLTVFVSATAWANEAPDAAAESEVEIVVVTGKKVDKGQNETTSNGALGEKVLLDTPFSVTVVDEADISKRQAASVAQIFVNDPSVFSSSPAGTTDWWGADPGPRRTLHGSVRYYGDAYFDDLHTVLIPHQTLANIGLQYRTEMYGHGVTFTGNINKVFDKAYREMNGVGEARNGALKVNW